MNLANFAACGTLRLFCGQPGVFQQLPRPLQKALAGGSQPHAALVALQQRDAEFVLKRTDLLAKRRLCHVQPFGGAGEVQFFGNGNEVTQVAQFHIDTFKVLNLT